MYVDDVMLVAVIILSYYWFSNYKETINRIGVTIK